MTYQFYDTQHMTSITSLTLRHVVSLPRHLPLEGRSKSPAAHRLPVGSQVQERLRGMPELRALLDDLGGAFLKPMAPPFRAWGGGCPPMSRLDIPPPRSGVVKECPGPGPPPVPHRPALRGCLGGRAPPPLSRPGLNSSELRFRFRLR